MNYVEAIRKLSKTRHLPEDLKNIRQKCGLEMQNKILSSFTPPPPVPSITLASLMQPFPN